MTGKVTGPDLIQVETGLDMFDPIYHNNYCIKLESYSNHDPDEWREIFMTQSVDKHT